MKVEESSGWLGEYEILITHKDGKQEREKVKNRITNAGLNMLRNGLLGTVTDLKIKYLALGTSNLAIDDSQTQLGSEQFRTAWVQQQATGTGQLQSTALVLDNEAVFNIREIGVFAGPADSNPNTGVLVSRILWSRDKTNLESIQFIRTDTIQRG